MQSQSKQETFEEFTLFLQLAPELRLKIWKMATRQPRVIEVNIYRVRGYPKHWRPITPNPGVLATCRESREEGLKVYKILERQNKVYRPEDGDLSDIPLGHGHGYDYTDRPERYNKYSARCSTPRGRANSFTQQMNAKPRSSSFVQDLEPAPTFRTYVNYDLDTIYFHTNHSCSPGALSDCIQSVNWAWWTDKNVPALQRIAFNIEHLRDLFQYNNMVESVRWAASDLSKLWIVAGDQCCGGHKFGHTAVKDFVEYASQDEVALSGADLTIYDDYMEECELELDHLRQDGISTRLEIVLGLAIGGSAKRERSSGRSFRRLMEAEGGQERDGTFDSCEEPNFLLSSRA